MTISLHNLIPSVGANRPKKRVGRGHGSGTHKTSGKGTKGQKARTGHHGLPKPGFEGGQTPIARRLPKKGFTNIFSDKPSSINLSDICRVFPNATKISVEDIKAARLVHKRAKHIKILAKGWEVLTKGIEIQAHFFSKQAEEKILKSGGRPVQVEKNN